jgi:5-methylcytosine-specific restriction enzyme subunit McrC
MRIELQEYGPWQSVETLATRTPYGTSAFSQRLQGLNSSICAQLGKNEALLKLVNGKVRAEKFAGVLSLDSWHQLEVAPKFLGGDAVHPDWRNDFVWLANMSRHGAFLEGLPVQSKAGQSEPLGNLFARALLRECEAHARRPVREYKTVVRHAFELDGDVDAEDLLLPSEDGFRQSVLHYSHHNELNGTISAALRSLLPAVTDPSLQARLLRALDRFGPQAACVNATKRAVPSRHSRWRMAVDLAKDVLSESGSHYGESNARQLPGFVVDTARVWQHLLEAALRSRFGSTMQPEPKMQLGKRQKADGTQKAINVYPDYVISVPAFSEVVVLDAKYKGRLDKGTGVAEADLFEALAFMKAVQSRHTLLLYPLVPVQAGLYQTGETSLVEVLEVGTQKIAAVTVEVRGIGARGGWQTFCKNLSLGIHARCTEFGLLVPVVA